jgi:hypothetical protein
MAKSANFCQKMAVEVSFSFLLICWEKFEKGSSVIGTALIVQWNSPFFIYSLI